MPWHPGSALAQSHKRAVIHRDPALHAPDQRFDLRAVLRGLGDLPQLLALGRVHLPIAGRNPRQNQQDRRAERVTASTSDSSNSDRRAALSIVAPLRDAALRPRRSPCTDRLALTFFRPFLSLPPPDSTRRPIRSPDDPSSPRPRAAPASASGACSPGAAPGSPKNPRSPHRAPAGCGACRSGTARSTAPSPYPACLRPRAPPGWPHRNSPSSRPPAPPRSATSRTQRTRTCCRAAPGCCAETPPR